MEATSAGHRRAMHVIDAAPTTSRSLGLNAGSASPTRQRIRWSIVALLVGWMIAAIMSTIAGTMGAIPVSLLVPWTLAVTVISAFGLYRRFAYLGRIDQTTTLIVVIVWTAMLGLLSL